MLIELDRSRSLPADCCEQLGNTLLSPVRFIFGSTIEIDEGYFVMAQWEHDLISRIAIGILTLVSFPITGTLALLGYMITLCSNTYSAALASLIWKKPIAICAPAPTPVDDSATFVQWQRVNHWQTETMQRRISEEGVGVDIGSKQCQLEDLLDQRESVSDEELFMELDSFIGSMRMHYNDSALSLLKTQLSTILGEELAERLVSDPDVVGLDVLTQRALLTTERSDRILSEAWAVKDYQDKLERLHAQLQRDLPANQEIIELMHPEFKHLPKLQGQELQNHYRVMINKAYLNSELKLRQGLHFNKEERSLLEKMGYDVGSSYTNKEITQLALQEVVARLIDPKQLTLPPKEIREHFAREAFTLRLKTAGVPLEHINNVKSAIQCFKEFRTDISNTLFKNRAFFYSLTPEKNKLLKEKFSSNFHLLLREKERVLKAYIEGYEIEFAEFVKGQIASPTLAQKLPHYQKSLILKAAQRNLHCQIEAEKGLKQYFELLELFFNERVEAVSFSQSIESDSDTLGEGVCAGFTFDLDMQLLNDRTKPLSQLHVDRITERERFIQASHALNVSLSSGRFPQALLDQYGVKAQYWAWENSKEKVPNDRYFAARLIELFKAHGEWERDNPGLELSIKLPEGDGHAIYIRFGERTIVSDSNFVTAEFHAENLEESIEWLSDMLVGLFYIYDIQRLVATRYFKAEPAEAH